jgi:L,D-transpeptidase YbiS
MDTALIPPAFLSACRQRGVRLTPEILLVSVARQRLVLCARVPATSLKRTQPREPLLRPVRGDLAEPGYRCEREFIASTSRFGTGQVTDSNRTPLGLHRIARKIGAGWPAGTVFESRRAVGFTWAGRPDAAIAHRILWLEGLEPGHNRGGNVDTFRRFIYIHGVGDESTLGRPASRGCVHLAAADLLPLYQRVPVGTLVWIAE